MDAFSLKDRLAIAVCALIAILFTATIGTNFVLEPAISVAPKEACERAKNHGFSRRDGHLQRNVWWSTRGFWKPTLSGNNGRSTRGTLPILG